MTELERTVAALAARVQRLEDELAIHRVIVRYGFAADLGDGEAAALTFTPDGVYDVDIGLLEGRTAIAGMLGGNRHQEMVGHCAHQIGPAVVQQIEGDRAVANGYSRVYLSTRAGTYVYRISFNRWELARTEGEWRIARRTTRMLGLPEALEVLRSAFA